MAFCAHCGTKLSESARFCSSCGTKVADIAPVVEATPVTETAPLVESVPSVEVVPVVEEAPVYMASQPVAEAVADEEILNENVYASVVAEPALESEPVSVPEAVASQAESQNVYAESVQNSVYAPAVPVSAQNSTDVPTSTKEEQQALLDNIYARLINERLCWKIFGFVWIGYVAMFTFLAIVGAPEALPLLVYAIVFAPLAIISFKMIGKVDYYMRTLYTDCAPVVERCSSVGMIVFGAIFNTVAMIFIIINFVNVTSNKKILEDIKRNQDAYRNHIL
ncbi:MAG: zinc-ribbon domain-containing protein [Ruminococcus sp.]|nr:zinc-ribbon domain-containing protein [Ruminococcus sp.]